MSGKDMHFQVPLKTFRLDGRITQKESGSQFQTVGLTYTIYNFTDAETKLNPTTLIDLVSLTVQSTARSSQL